MIKKKVCLIGGYAIGKTSLVQQFVTGIFSESYLTTVGVKIDKRNVEVGDKEALLMIWDLAGSDQFASVCQSHYRGAEGFLFVVDGTRRETLTAAMTEQADIAQNFPKASSIILVNKSDLTDEWEVNEDDLQPFRDLGITVYYTNAKSGKNVAEAFQSLTEDMVTIGSEP